MSRATGPRSRYARAGVIYASEALVREMDEKVREQASNVATAARHRRPPYAMPDAHWGYGFPIGGVAAFDPDEGGVSSRPAASASTSPAACAAAHRPRRATTSSAVKDRWPTRCSAHPRRRGQHRQRSGSTIARWTRCCGRRALGGRARLRQRRRTSSASRSTAGCRRDPAVSASAKKRQRDEMGTLGSGNHYLEVQRVAEIFDEQRRARSACTRATSWSASTAARAGSAPDRHRVPARWRGAPDSASPARPRAGLRADRSELGEEYLGAMRAAINCALANRQILTHLTRAGVRRRCCPHARLPLLYDVSHNTCKVETTIDGRARGCSCTARAPRARSVRASELPEALRAAGQPVLIGGTMGTGLVRARRRASEAEALSFGSACHGAGRAMSRHQATRTGRARQVVDELAARGILIAAPRCAASPRKRPAPTRTSARWSTPPSARGSRARWRGSSR
jgi:tRNA-splicing ligase RtcB (3'-phosphate/5'-hydroxy nucleic acid ligase)